MQHGKLSAKIGKKIAESVRRAQRNELTVYFDSGEKTDGTKLPLYCGSRDPLTPQGILADIDIVVADMNAGCIVVMCKFGKEDVEASYVLGDMTIMLASEKLRIRGRDFSTDGAHCILGYRCEETKQEGFGMAQKRVQSYGYLLEPMICDERRRGIDFTLIARKDYEKIFEEMQRVICHKLEIAP